MRRLSLFLALTLALGLTACASVPKLPPVPNVVVTTAATLQDVRHNAVVELKYTAELTAEMQSLEIKAHGDGAIPDGAHLAAQRAFLKIATDNKAAVDFLDGTVTRTVAEIKAKLDPIVADINDVMQAFQSGPSWKDRFNTALSVALLVFVKLTQAGVLR